jgi:uncharacterized protein
VTDLTSTNAAAPTAPEARIETLDVVRGFALLGILLVNIVQMGLPVGAYYNPAAHGEPSSADLIAWATTQTFFEGAMRTLFSMLFGAGFVMFLDRVSLKLPWRSVLAAYFRRMIGLMIFGLIDIGLLIWSGDILFVYGLAGLVLLPFWRAPVRALIIWAIAVFFITSSMNIAAGAGYGAQEIAGLTESKAPPTFWNPTAESLAQDIESRSSWPGAAVRALSSRFLWGGWTFQLKNLFDVLGPMLLGIVAYRWGLLQGQWPPRRTLILLAGAGVIALPVNIFETWLIWSSGFAADGFFDHLESYDLGRVSLALTWLALLLLACRAPWLKWLRATLAAVGRMALSNYLAHSAMAAVLFVGLGYFNAFSRAELYYVVAAFWAFNIAFSLLWLRRFTMGPAEWVWRAGTYGRWPDIRRRKANNL